MIVGVFIFIFFVLLFKKNKKVTMNKTKSSMILKGTQTAFLLLISLFAFAISFELWATRNETIDSGIKNSENTLKNISIYYDSAISKADIVLKETISEYKNKRITHGSMDEKVKSIKHLIDLNSQLPEAQKNSLLIASATGEIVLTALDNSKSGFTLTDQGYFEKHKISSFDNLEISSPISESLFNKRLVIVLSRKITNNDGSFGGIAQINIPLDYFQTQIDLLKVNKNFVIGVYDFYGNLIARRPQLNNVEEEPGETHGEKIQKEIEISELLKNTGSKNSIGINSIYKESNIDRLKRDYVYNDVGQFKFIAGESRNEILTLWNFKATLYLSGGLLLLIVSCLYWFGQKVSIKIHQEHGGKFDQITGLSNRVRLIDSFSGELKEHEDGHPCLIVLGLDDFKQMNDALGSVVCDEVLSIIASRLYSVFNNGKGSVIRSGGDNFALFTHVKDTKDAERLARIAQVGVDLDFKLLKGEYVKSPGCSVGIAMAPSDGNKIEILLGNAESALKAAKEHSKGSIRFYNKMMNSGAAERFKIATDLKSALSKKQIELWYQPQYDIKAELIGFEALMRWNHPELGFLAPFKFIDIAEQNGVIRELGAWALKEACVQNKKWQKEYGFKGLIAVNVSSMQLKNLKEFKSHVVSALKYSGLEPKYLELELTESCLMEKAEEIKDLLIEFKKVGIKVAIDDFGTGYSSLNYLKTFPTDKIKIDKSFISDANKSDEAIVKAVVSIAKALGVKTIAEGVETEEQIKMLMGYGCGELQGYFFSKPVPACDASKFLEAKK